MSDLFDNSFGNYMLHGIDEISLPPAVSWWPQTLGWKLLLLAAAVSLWSTGPLAEISWAQENEQGAHHDEHEEEEDHPEDEEHEGEDPDEHDDHADDDHGDEAEDEHAEEGLIHLEDAELEEFGVQLVNAGESHLGITLKVPGRVVMPTDRVAHVVPRLPGFAREIRAALGDESDQSCLSRRPRSKGGRAFQWMM